MRRILRMVAVLIITVVVVPASTAGVILASFLFLPLPATLPEPRPGIDSQISRIYDVNGAPIGVFKRFETTKPVLPEDIPLVLKQAVISGEDRRFYEHGGVDVQGTLRALWADIRNRAAVQGGSTITQQYVKNAYVGSERSLDRKIREAVLASQLDRQVDKDEILFRYLQQIYLGEGAYGVGAAAETYFRKSVRDLTLSEAAMLAGLIPAPSLYEPRGNWELAEKKRVIVLDAMLEEGHIDQATHDAAVLERVWYAGPYGPPPPGTPATVVWPPERAETPFPYFVDYLERYLVQKYGEDALYRGGLQIYTTIDPRLQAEAERAVGETLDGTNPPLEMSLVAVEPPTGHVRALVGGRDWNVSRVNLALGQMGGGTGRQPGSTFKAFVLAEAFEQGVSPKKAYSGADSMDVNGHVFHNYGGSSYGTMDLTSATRKSVNTIFVQLLRDVGVEETMKLAHDLGITTSIFQPGTHGLSIALGALDVSPLDMASAFGVFAARGERAEPTPVRRVLDNTGKVLEDNEVPARHRVISEVSADNVNKILRGVLEPGGTAAGKGLDRPAAGKTGTAQDNKDAWFVGYTPTLSTAVWMGFTEPDPVTGKLPLLKGIKGVRAVTGGSFPAQTWQSFMRAALEGVPVTDFTEPAPIEQRADALKAEARRGFDTGERRYAQGTGDGGSFVQAVQPPRVSAPAPPTTTTTTTRPPSTATTTTTRPSDDDD